MGTMRFEKRRKRKIVLHFCGDDNSAELVLRTIISVNQLSFYRAVADMCGELACRISDCSESTGKLVARDNPETTVKLAARLRATIRTSSISSSIDQAKLQCSYHEDRGEERQYFTTLDDAELEKLEAHVESRTRPRDDKLSKS